MSSNGVATGQVERRFFDGGKVTLRAVGDEETRGISGLGIPVGVTADIGPFTEEISREAVMDALEQDWDVRGLFNHDPNMVLGRTKSGTMDLVATARGMEFDIPELPESRADVLEAIERGDVDGNSFSFTVAKEEWDESEEREKPHRTIKRFARLFDTGPVTYPAYEGQTTVSVRAMDHARQWSEERELAAEIEALADAEHEDNVTHRRRQLQAVQAREAARSPLDAA